MPPPVGRQRILKPTLPAQNIAEGAVCLGQVRLERDRRPIRLLGFGGTIQLAEGIAEVEMEIRPVGRKRDRTAERRLRLLGPRQAVESGAKVVMGDGQV